MASQGVISFKLKSIRGKYNIQTEMRRRSLLPLNLKRCKFVDFLQRIPQCNQVPHPEIENHQPCRDPQPPSHPDSTPKGYCVGF